MQGRQISYALVYELVDPPGFDRNAFLGLSNTTRGEDLSLQRSVCTDLLVCRCCSKMCLGLKLILMQKNSRRFHHISFKYAFEGVSYAFKTQPNFQVHVIFFSLATIASIFFDISRIEYLIILLISALIFSLELLNTAIEALGDKVSGGEWDELIKVTKDTTSGAVLVASVFSLAIATVIFVPKVLEIHF